MSMRQASNHKEISGIPVWPPPKTQPGSNNIRNAFNVQNTSEVDSVPKVKLQRHTSEKSQACALRHKNSNDKKYSTADLQKMILNSDDRLFGTNTSPTNNIYSSDVRVRSRSAANSIAESVASNSSTSSAKRTEVLGQETNDTIARIARRKKRETIASNSQKNNSKATEDIYSQDRLRPVSQSITKSSTNEATTPKVNPTIGAFGKNVATSISTSSPYRKSTSPFRPEDIAKKPDMRFSMVGGLGKGDDLEKLAKQKQRKSRGAMNRPSLAKGVAYAAFEKLKDATDIDEVLTAFNGLVNACPIVVEGGSFSAIHKLLSSVENNNYKNMRIFKILQEYQNQSPYSEKPMKKRTVLIIGAGPVGLRLAVELRLLGATVHIIEKRKTFSRTNILHLWEWVVQDIIALGGKCWDNKFGYRNEYVHFGTKNLQLILAKTAVLLGVNIHVGVNFHGIDCNYREITEPPLEGLLKSNDDVDALFDCSGASPSLEFDRCFTETSQAIGIVTQFENRLTPQEQQMKEFAWSRQFNHELFTKLDKKKIELENCVYYKGDVHYFVFTPTKRCLLNNKVLKENLPKEHLLESSNVDKNKLDEFVGRLASFFELPRTCMFVPGNHALLFDFSRLSRATEGAAVVKIGKSNRKKLIALCGDALMEPFWPEGLGVIRGNLIALDTAWMLLNMDQDFTNSAAVFAERNKHYAVVRSLSSFTAKKTLIECTNGYTIDPATRYLKHTLTQSVGKPSSKPPKCIKKTKATQLRKKANEAVKQTNAKSKIKENQDNQGKRNRYSSKTRGYENGMADDYFFIKREDDDFVMELSDGEMDKRKDKSKSRSKSSKSESKHASSKHGKESERRISSLDSEDEKSSKWSKRSSVGSHSSRKEIVPFDSPKTVSVASNSDEESSSIQSGNRSKTSMMSDNDTLKAKEKLSRRSRSRRVPVKPDKMDIFRTEHSPIRTNALRSRSPNPIGGSNSKLNQKLKDQTLKHSPTKSRSSRARSKSPYRSRSIVVDGGDGSPVGREKPHNSSQSNRSQSPLESSHRQSKMDKVKTGKNTKMDKVKSKSNHRSHSRGRKSRKSRSKSSEHHRHRHKSKHRHRSRERSHESKRHGKRSSSRHNTSRTNENRQETSSDLPRVNSLDSIDSMSDAIKAIIAHGDDGTSSSNESTAAVASLPEKLEVKVNSNFAEKKAKKNTPKPKRGFFLFRRKSKILQHHDDESDNPDSSESSDYASDEDTIHS